MKLDTKALRYLTNEDWRVLTAVEQGSRNHEVVPTALITQIAGLRGGSGVHRSISTLAKANLIGRERNARYDGYRLKYGGLDYLALHAHTKKAAVYSVGNQIGVGKESDIFMVASPAGVQHVLKIHRLGRVSFRTVKANRDYLRRRSTGSWMYMSRLAAVKEHAFMAALHAAGFPVPTPVAQNRHTIVMELIDAFPLRQIDRVPDPAKLYGELMELILGLAGVGLIHGDFNEFNLLIKEEPDDKDNDNDNTDTTTGSEDEPPPLKLTPVMIDFPQMVSVDHANAESYFDRDVACVKRFFERRFGFTSDAAGPTFEEGRARIAEGSRRLDVEVEASGFSRKMAKELEQYMQQVGVKGDAEREEDGDGEDEDEDDEDEEDKEEGGDNDGEEDKEEEGDNDGEESNEHDHKAENDGATRGLTCSKIKDSRANTDGTEERLERLQIAP